MRREDMREVLNSMYPDTVFLEGVEKYGEVLDFVDEESKIIIRLLGRGIYTSYEESMGEYDSRELLVRDGYEYNTFPFWLGMDEEICRLYFGIEGYSGRDIPISFDDGVQPQDFNELGLMRLKQDLDVIGDDVVIGRVLDSMVGFPKFITRSVFSINEVSLLIDEMGVDVITLGDKTVDDKMVIFKCDGMVEEDWKLVVLYDGVIDKPVSLFNQILVHIEDNLNLGRFLRGVDVDRLECWYYGKSDSGNYDRLVAQADGVRYIRDEVGAVEDSAYNDRLIDLYGEPMDVAEGLEWEYENQRWIVSEVSKTAGKVKKLKDSIKKKTRKGEKVVSLFG